METSLESGCAETGLPRMVTGRWLKSLSNEDLRRALRGVDQEWGRGAGADSPSRRRRWLRVYAELARRRLLRGGLALGAAIFAFWLLSPQTARAQESSAGEGAAVRFRTDLVVIDALVVRKSGGTPVGGLKPEDFILHEEGVRLLRPRRGDPWIIGGDFNLSETFDDRASGPRGNREYLGRMNRLGLTDCLREAKKALTPTYSFSRKSIVKHQIDHLFVTDTLRASLVTCDTGSRQDVFEGALSDHLPIIADFAWKEPREVVDLASVLSSRVAHCLKRVPVLQCGLTE